VNNLDGVTIVFRIVIDSEMKENGTLYMDVNCFVKKYVEIIVCNIMV
jgi:hypothetical protein